MMCGLFSSFDPGVMAPENSSSITHVKWVMVVVVFAMMSWQVFLLPSGKNMVMKKMIVFLSKVIKDSSFSPEKVFLTLFTLFLLIMSLNLWGLTPYSFSLSSHLSVNLSLSLPLWGGGVIYSVMCSFEHLLSHVVPLGSPIFLWPLLVIVETVSTFIRPFTLSIRLMANVMAGHLIMSLMGEFFSMSESLIPLSTLLVGSFLAFEMCISCIQAYVFMSLLSLYWKESEDH